MGHYFVWSYIKWRAGFLSGKQGGHRGVSQKNISMKMSAFPESIVTWTNSVTASTTSCRISALRTQRRFLADISVCCSMMSQHCILKRIMRLNSKNDCRMVEYDKGGGRHLLFGYTDDRARKGIYNRDKGIRRLEKTCMTLPQNKKTIRKTMLMKGTAV